jgi:dihydroflavonol-4-reductase
MSDYDTTSPVLVTGATGYVAGWVVKRLLEEGFTVHAAVRDPSNAEKLKYLNALAEQASGTIRYFRSDLMERGSYAEAMQGCSVVFHTASPFVVGVEDPQRDLIDPAVNGTRNVLEEANRTPSVKRVVVTSSCAAIYGDNTDLKKTPNGTFTEEVWNTSSSIDHQAYSYSKTLAEREAWAIAEAQDRWDLVTVNPTLVLGPAINPHASGESMSLIKQFGDGSMKAGVPDIGMGIVDVRDVAEMHMKAAFDPAARGRYITSGHNSSFPEIGSTLRDHFGDAYPFPKKTLPKWLVWLVGPIADKRMTRKMIGRNVGYPWIGDNSKSVRGLGMTYRPLADSVVEMFQQMIDSEVIAAK